MEFILELFDQKSRKKTQQRATTTGSTGSAGACSSARPRAASDEPVVTQQSQRRLLWAFRKRDPIESNRVREAEERRKRELRNLYLFDGEFAKSF